MSSGIPVPVSVMSIRNTILSCTGLDFYFPAARHGFHGILKQIEQRLFDLVPIDGNSGQISRYNLLYFDIELGEVRPLNLDDFINQTGKLSGLKVISFSPRDRAKLPSQLVEARDLIL